MPRTPGGVRRTRTGALTCPGSPPAAMSGSATRAPGPRGGRLAARPAAWTDRGGGLKPPPIGPGAPVTASLAATNQTRRRAASCHRPPPRPVERRPAGPAGDQPLVVARRRCFAQFMVVLDATSSTSRCRRSRATSSPRRRPAVGHQRLHAVFGGLLLLGGRAADLLGRRGMFVDRHHALLGRLADQRPRVDSARCSSSPARCRARRRAHVARGALDHHHDVRARARSAPRRSASGARSRPAAARPACCSAACSPSCCRWEWIFFVNVPIGIAVIVAAYRLVPESRADGPARIRPAGALTVTAGLDGARLRDRQGARAAAGARRGHSACRRRRRPARAFVFIEPLAGAAGAARTSSGSARWRPRTA